MERNDSKNIKLTPRDAKLAMVCDLSLPSLDVKEMHFKLEIDSRDEDTTDDYRKNRTKNAQSRNKNALF